MSSFTNCWTFVPDDHEYEVTVEATINCVAPSDPGVMYFPDGSGEPPSGPEWEVEHFALIGGHCDGGIPWLQDQFETHCGDQVSQQVDNHFSLAEDYDPYEDDPDDY